MPNYSDINAEQAKAELQWHYCWANKGLTTVTLLLSKQRPNYSDITTEQAKA